MKLVKLTKLVTNRFKVLANSINFQRSGDMIRLVPYLNNGVLGKVFKPELANTIHSMGIKMEPEEFDKLWKKFDSEALGNVKADVFLKKLGLNIATSDNAASSDFDDTLISIPIANLGKLFTNFLECFSTI